MLQFHSSASLQQKLKALSECLAHLRANHASNDQSASKMREHVALCLISLTRKIEEQLRIMQLGGGIFDVQISKSIGFSKSWTGATIDIDPNHVISIICALSESLIPDNVAPQFCESFYADEMSCMEVKDDVMSFSYDGKKYLLRGLSEEMKDMLQAHIDSLEFKRANMVCFAPLF
jgi:hypothetical protein